MKKVIANDNVIIQDKVIDIYLENENIYVEKIHLAVDFYRELIGKYK